MDAGPGRRSLLRGRAARQRFTLMPWNKAESGNPDFYHLCGQGCAMQAMERFMNHGSIVSDGALHGAA